MKKHFYIYLFIFIFFCSGCLYNLPYQDEDSAEPETPDLATEEEPESRDMRKELGRQFLAAIGKELSFLDEPEVLSLVNSVGREVALSAGSDPDYYHFFVIKKNQLNAFAVPGGYIFLYDGLLKNLESVDALAGVLAHEIAHVERDHHFKDSGKEGLADLATMVGLILGGIATGRPDASVAIAQGANISYKLKLSREHEEDADIFALKYLDKSRYDPRGLPDFFGKLIRHERLNIDEDFPSYLSTHPGVVERRVIVEGLIGSDEKMDMAKEGSSLDWERVVTILKGVNHDVLNISPAASMSKERRHYLQGIYALKSNDLNKALAEYRAAISINPSNPLYHADLATTYLKLQMTELAEKEALKCIELAEDKPAPFIVLGMIAAERSDYKRAVRYLEKALKISPYDSFAHYHIAYAYHELKKPGMGRYHLGQYHRLNLDADSAIMQYKMALEETDDEALAHHVEGVLKKVQMEGI